MNTLVGDPMQEACDEAGGFEGLRANHNCKEGKLFLGGVAVEAIKAVFLMEEAQHGELEFDVSQKLIYRDLKRYAKEKPSRGKMDPGRKPNTSCLCVFKDTGAIGTYAGSSWKVRIAFEAQLLKPYQRARKLRVFPVVSLGFIPGQRDEHGNHMPDFAIVGWEPRSKFALILGEGEREPLAAIEAPRKLMTVTSGLGDAIESVPDGYAGPDCIDDVDFS
jgi:hypothetical protein